MRKVIAAINMTIDGYCDHTAATPDEDLMNHFNALLAGAGTLLYGRITYELMEEAWPPLVANPSGNGPDDEFARLIDGIEKVVYSHTRHSFPWRNSKMAERPLKEELESLRQESGKDILIGSVSLIREAIRERLADEYQFCVHPVIIGRGKLLFEPMCPGLHLQLVETRVFRSGAVLHRYLPA